MTEQKYLRLVVEISIKLAQIDCSNELSDDNKDDREFIKGYVQIVRDCFTILGKMGYRLVEKEPSWDEWIERPENRATKYVFQELDKMIDEEQEITN